MKILVLSDSHGIIGQMERVVAKMEPHVACVMFLGDYLRDIERVANNFPDVIFHWVPGNCDFMSDAPRELMVEIAGKKVWMSHGDRFGVKSSYGHIEAAAATRGADICLFGHSHIASSYEKNGILFLNPGSISEPRGPKGKSYAVVEILGNVVLSKVVEL